MVNGAKQLPDGWEIKKLEEICVPPQYGWTTSGSAEGNLHLLRTTDITSGVVNWDTVPFCAEEPPDKEKYLLHDGDIVISRAGSVGYSHLIKNPRPAIFASYLIRFRPLINEKYLAYFLQSPSYWQAISEQSLGIAIPNVNASKLKKIQVPIAPVNEQERIVAKIEELFTQLEAGTSALAKVQAGLRRYKASVLKAAVSGRLVNGNLELGEVELPAGWRWIDFREIMQSLKNGFFYGRPATEPPGIPILRISAVRPLSVNLGEPRFIPDVDEEKVNDYFLEKGDLLFTRYNGNMSLVGACGMVRELPKPTVYPDKLIRVKVDRAVVLPEYIEIYFATQTARKFVEGRVKSTAGQHGIAGGDIRSIPVILPPLDEQRRIVSEVERRLSVARQVETAVEVALVRASRLRQAVLKSAFEGRLVNGL